jgi:hypothetical protein
MARPKVTVATWRSWLAAVEQDIYAMHADRLHWRETVRIVKANPSIPEPGYVMDWITRMYISHVASGIRRQMEEAPHVVSLRKLLSSIYRNPGLLTREQFLDAWGAGREEFEIRSANATFDRMFAAAGRRHIEPGKVKDDLAVLMTAGAKVKRFVDERVAHLHRAHTDPEEIAKLTAPTFNELDDALSMLGTLLQKYYLLLTGATLGSAEPFLQYNWTAPFTVAWLPSAAFSSEPESG